MYVTVKKPGSNRNQRVLVPSTITREMIRTMTERTQLQTFGGLVKPAAADRSIHDKVMTPDPAAQIAKKAVA